MPLKFVSHKEIAFSHLFGMLRTPPIAMMNYYSNLFLSAKFVFSGDDSKIRFIDKEILRIESMVGVREEKDSKKKLEQARELGLKRKKLEHELEELYAMIGIVTDEEESEKVIEKYKETKKKIDELNSKEYMFYHSLKPIMKLKEMETYMENNMDLKSFFKE